jgi:hypothetical protein
LITAGYGGFNEGHLISLLSRFERAIDSQYAVFTIEDDRVLITNIAKRDLKRRIFATVREIVSEASPAAPWFDKTPGTPMIRSLPIVARLWPGSVFIFAKRRAIENVMSRLKKFPQQTFAAHCSDWARIMTTWRAMRGRLEPNRYIELDQHDLVRHPDVVAERLGELLHLPDENTRILAKTFRSVRPEESERGSASTVYSLDATGWSDLRIEAFRRQCTSEMEAFGYSMDESYWADPQVAGSR